MHWTTIAMIVLGFWLSASLIIDFLILPGLSVSGMMTQNGFASAGYLVFGVFNRVEILCAAIVLCSFVVFHRYHTLIHLPEHRSLLFAGILVAIPLVYTYFLTPNLSGFGLLDPLNAVSGLPPGMMPLQMGYWILEVFKLAIGFTLLRWCFRDSFKLA
jgi:hypothetical protein